VLRLSIFVGTALCVGCPSTRPEPPRAGDDTALRVRIAHAEARRDVNELVELAGATDARPRELALRGLGRVGGARAIEALERALDDREPRVAAAALAAIGLAGSLDELDAATQARLSPKLVAMLGRDKRVALAALEALGRSGDTSVQGELAARAGEPDAAVASSAAIALARHGRRKLAWTAQVRAAIARATSHDDASVRYAATYALAREHEPPADEAVNAALAARIADEQPETRAQAIAGLAKRKAVAAAREAIEDSLHDRDWRVAVEAVRALAGASGDEAGRRAVANALGLRLNEAAKGNPADIQIVIEGVRTSIAHRLRDASGVVAVSRMAETAREMALPPLAVAWIDCLAGALHVSGLATADASWAEWTVDCAEGALPDHLRLPLLAELVTAKVGDASFRRAAVRLLFEHADPRVRAAGLTVLPSAWSDGDARAQATVVSTITSALATKNDIVAGTAVEVAGELYDLIGADRSLRAPLDTAILARAKAETDVELAGSLYAAIGKRAIAGGADVCRAGLTGHPARAKAAAECLRALGEANANAIAGATVTPLPPALPETVIGKQLVWKLQTTRGEIAIELRPDVAPWAVASIVALTRRGVYDGIEFHRVVPNFVVQGGDPTMSGWGGPGYTLPAEPASSLDGPGYVAAGVGMADAGPGSAGSQWFIMHARAPHLDGRYTWIGSVIAGQKSAEALLIGDKVVRATIVESTEQR
jgi:cyclophilin family peptidyl-prolyl cis-trans isomerase/HEAT repeat protein